MREHDGRAILERLEPFALAARLEQQPSTESGIGAAFLVEESRIGEFSEAVATLGREWAGRIRLRYVGPLPPYSFTGERTAAWA